MLTEATLQNIFRKGFANYKAKHKLPSFIHKAAWNIMNCRTAIMGGHVEVCPEGHYERNHYNSCKHRMCPQCAFIQIQKWLSKQQARILACDHYHVIFTIPHELNVLWRFNVKKLTSIYFLSARDTVFELLEDDKYLGAKPGIIGTLHTWTKTLLLHPHVHFLVTGGGLKDGKWQPLKRDFLFPFRVARKLFRGKFRANVLKALSKKELILPIGMSEQKLLNLMNKLGRKKWNVKICEKYSHGNGVLSYLARYLRGGPISKSRLINFENNKVTFNVGRGEKIPMTLNIEEFISRFLQHVAQPNSVLVRHYGIYTGNNKEKLELCRKQLGQGEIKYPKELKWQDILEKQFSESEVKPWLCPVCGKKLITRSLLGLKSGFRGYLKIPLFNKKAA